MENIMNNVKREKFEHIDKYLKEPIVKNVIIGNGSLEKDVENFYGIHPYFRAARGVPIRGDTLDKIDENKFGTNPFKLIEIVSPFSEDEINISKLDYNLVRDSLKWNKKMTLKRAADVAYFTGTFLGTGIAGFYSFVNPLIGVPLTLCLGYLHFKESMRGISEHPKDQGGYDEFNKLWEASMEADCFILGSYRSHFIENSLNL